MLADTGCDYSIIAAIFKLQRIGGIELQFMADGFKRRIITEIAVMQENMGKGSFDTGWRFAV